MLPKLCLIFLLICLPLSDGSEISFSVSTTVIKHLVTDQLLMRCSLRDSTLSTKNNKLTAQHGSQNSQIDAQNSQDMTSRDDSPSDIKFLSSIVLKRNNADIAAVSKFMTVTSYDNTTSATVTGQIQKVGPEQGYIQMTWDYPGPDQSGTYTCEVSGYDDHGHPKMVTKTIEVLENEVSLHDLLSFIHNMQVTNKNLTMAVTDLQNKDQMKTDIIANLTRIIQDQHELNEENTASIRNLTNSLNTCNANIRTLTNAVNTCNVNIGQNTASIGYLTNSMNTCNANIHQLSTKLNTKVAFSAGLTTSTSFNDNQTVIFDKTIHNIGDGYDNVTGVFTCPVEGEYVFNVHVLDQSDKLLQVTLYHNNDMIVYLYVDDKHEYQAASNSVSLSLKVGDTVDVRSWQTTSYLHGWASPPLTTFTGYML